MVNVERHRQRIADPLALSLNLVSRATVVYEHEFVEAHERLLKLPWLGGLCVVAHALEQSRDLHLALQ